MISGKAFSVSSVANPQILALLFLIFSVTGLTAGLYPSFYIARFNPRAALKGLRNSASDHSLLLRRTLVIIQFSASVVLIITTLVIVQQMRFVREQLICSTLNSYSFISLTPIPLMSYAPIPLFPFPQGVNPMDSCHRKTVTFSSRLF